MYTKLELSDIDSIIANQKATTLLMELIKSLRTSQITYRLEPSNELLDFIKQLNDKIDKSIIQLNMSYLNVSKLNYILASKRIELVEEFNFKTSNLSISDFIHQLCCKHYKFINNGRMLSSIHSRIMKGTVIQHRFVYDDNYITADLLFIGGTETLWVFNKNLQILHIRNITHDNKVREFYYNGFTGF